MTVGTNRASIKLASVTDVAVVTDIIRNAFKDVANRFNLTEHNCPKHPSNCREQWIEDAMQKGVRYYVVEVDGIQSGCVALEQVNAEVCYLERLAVLPAYRRSGYGCKLVEYALGEAKFIGVQRVDIGIIAADIVLKDWYQQLGFEVTKKATFDHLPFEVIYMSKVV